MPVDDKMINCDLNSFPWRFGINIYFCKISNQNQNIWNNSQVDTLFERANITNKEESEEICVCVHQENEDNVWAKVKKNSPRVMNGIVKSTAVRLS